MTDPTMREQQIIELLHIRNELTTGTREGIQGDGNSVPLLPHDRHCRMHAERVYGKLKCTCYIASLHELARCLKELRATHWQLYDHVRLRYLDCDRRPRTVTVRNRKALLAPNQQLLGLLPTHKGSYLARVQIETWNPRADPHKALAGVTWLANTYQGEPRLPAQEAA